jgi:hypothetical protein
MKQAVQSVCVPVGPGIQIKIGKPEECWKTLASLICRRACAIYERRATTREEGPEIWHLAESQIERPLCCGMLKLNRGWQISFDAAEMGTTEIDVCVEPRRLILLGKKSIGGTGATDSVVRVLKLPNEVDPGTVSMRREGPIIDIELQDAEPGQHRAAARA